MFKIPSSPAPRSGSSARSTSSSSRESPTRSTVPRTRLKLKGFGPQARLEDRLSRLIQRNEHTTRPPVISTSPAATSTPCGAADIVHPSLSFQKDVQPSVLRRAKRGTIQWTPPSDPSTDGASDSSDLPSMAGHQKSVESTSSHKSGARKRGLAPRAAATATRGHPTTTDEDASLPSNLLKAALSSEPSSQVIILTM